MSRHRFWKNALVNRRPARHTTPLRVERLEARDLPAAPVPADIVSWYRAEGDASDFVGDNNGTVVNGATFTAGKVGQAFLFDGFDDHVSILDDASLEPGTNFTIEAWVNPSTSGHGRPIAEKRAGNGNAYTFETTHAPYGPNDGLQFVVYIGGVQQNFLQTPAGVMQNNTWQHVAATYDGSTLRIFVNGVQQAESAVEGAIDDVSAPTVIGLNSVAAFAWMGAIDEPSFYNRALSQEELQSIVDADSEGKELPDDYDAAGDFSIAGNPNGAWSYGWSPSLGGAFTKDISTRSGHPHPELQSWDGPIETFFPVISKNTTNATVVVGTVTWQPGQMVNHPGPGGEYSVLRWTAPKAGEVEFSASFSGADSTTTDVHVLFNETAIADGNVNGFGAGPTFSQSLVVEIGDTIDFVVGFGNNGYTSDSTGVDVGITYVDENPPTPDLSVTISDAPEPVLIGDPVTYTVTVTNNGPLDATGVSVAALGPPDQEFNSVTIPIGDLASGATRSFQIVFTPAAVGTFSATAIVTANESDSNPTNNSFTETTVVAPRSFFELAQAQYEVREGEKFAVLTVRRTGNLENSASVEFITVNGTAGQRGIGTGLLRIDDFTTTSGELFFRPRSNVATIRVPIGDDRTVESDETFHVVLSNPSAGTGLGTISSAEVIIHDNDPAVQFVAASSERGEASPSNLNKIGVKLLSPSTRKVTVAYSVTGGTAVVGTDFNLPRTQTLIFQPGETQKFITVTLSNDTLYEGDETAIIELSSPTNAFIGTQARHRLTIVDNDPQPPPVEPGSTPDTALFIDLQTLPRQSFKDILFGNIDKDTFRVHLGANERLVLDVDPDPIRVGQDVLFPGIATSTLVFIAPDKVTELGRIGRSAEPDTGVVTNNAAALFQATTEGDYYIRLEKATTVIAGYRLHFHRLGVSENVPAPNLLNVTGAMFAWYDGEDTVGITGPTGYGFTLEGPWQQQVTTFGKSSLRSQTLTLNSGAQFTLHSEQGFDLPLIANGPIVIATKAQRWGDRVGEVNANAINFPVSLGIAPVNDFLADVFGSQVSVGLLSGNWRISLGGKVLAVSTDKGLKNTNAPIDQLLDGVPYLRQKGPINITANLGPISISYPVIEKPVDWAFDPADPMLYLRAEELGAAKQPTLAISLHGLLEYKPLDLPAPEIEAGVTEFYGHIFGAATIPFKIGPIPFEADAEVLISVDADRDGLPLGDLRDAADLFDVLDGDFSEVREILNDVQIGINGRLDLVVIEDEFNVELGRSSVVLNGLAETIWVRGQQGGVNPFAGTPLESFNPGTQTVVVEGMINWDGDFLLSTTTFYNVDQINFEYGIKITNDGITAHVTGKAEFNARIDIPGGSVSGKATVEIDAEISIDIDDDGDPHLSGSITASGKLKASGTEYFSGSIDAFVRNRGFRFKLPRGVGNLDLDLF